MMQGWKIGLALGLASAFFAAPANAQSRTAGERRAPGLGNLSIVNAGGVQFRWRHEGISLDLVAGQQSWTQAEAVLVRDALDKLPTVYLAKAQSGGAQKIQRDTTTPQAPWNFIEPPGPNIVAVAVPPAPWNYIALTNEVFKDANETYRVVTHELGHCALLQESLAILFRMIMTEGGWGVVEEIDLLSSPIRVVVSNTPEPRRLGHTGRCSCHLMTGIYAGYFETLFGAPCHAWETTCRSGGDPVCTFELALGAEPSSAEAEPAAEPALEAAAKS